jgi:hypothetical protein
MNRFTFAGVGIAVLFLTMHCASASNVPEITNSPIKGAYTARELQELLRQWNAADGESVFIVSDRLAFFLAGNPVQFYAGMARHANELRRWLSQLGGTTFTDYGHSCIDRRCLREQMIRAVEKNPSPAPELDDVRSRILETLRNTEIRTVD